MANFENQKLDEMVKAPRLTMASIEALDPLLTCDMMVASISKNLERDCDRKMSKKINLQESASEFCRLYSGSRGESY